MDIKEAKRVVITKPVASRPACSTIQSFSELLAGAINSSPHNEPLDAKVAVIRPKTVRVKPMVNHSQAVFGSSWVETYGAASCNSSDTTSKPVGKQSVVYRPLAKLVSKTAVSLLANMGNFCPSQQQEQQTREASHQHSNQDKRKCATHSSLRLQQIITLHAETNKTIEPSKMASQNDEDAIPSTVNGDRPSYDGYKWRKYGQKHVKGSEYPRSYYKCTHPNCPVKKKVERLVDGQNAEVVYKGEHNHPKPQPPKDDSLGIQEAGFVSDGTGQENKNQLWSYHPDEQNEDSEDGGENQNNAILSEQMIYQGKTLLNNDAVPARVTDAGGGTPENSCSLSGECEEGSKDLEQEDYRPRRKRRKSKKWSNKVGLLGEGLLDPRIVVQSSRESEILGDGFRWRKYGQKVVKGNTYPRSYYRCSNTKCDVRKHVERVSDDPTSFITTYEGKHNHEMPLKSQNAVASEIDLQASKSKEMP